MRAKKTVKVILVCLFVLIGLFILGWFTGLIARFVIIPVVNSRLPSDAGKGAVIEKVAIRTLKGPEIEGVTLTISPERLMELVKQFTGMSGLLLKGVIRHGLVVDGYVNDESLAFMDNCRMPVRIVTDRRSVQPKVRCILPLDVVNEYLASDEVMDALSSKEEYFLGSYEIFYKIELDELRVFSDDRDLNPPVTRRDLKCEAKGKVRIKIIENIGRPSVEGKIRKLTGKISVDVGRDEKGVFFSYRADIDRISLNVDNVMGLADDVLAEKLRKSWEKSLNKEKKRVKFSARRFPEWIPVDIVFEAELKD